MAGPAAILNRVLFAIPLIAGALCVLGVLPWLAAAQGDPEHVEAYAVGTIALVAYPVLQAATLIAGVYAAQHSVMNRAMTRSLFYGLFMAFVVTFGTALFITLA